MRRLLFAVSFSVAAANAAADDPLAAMLSIDPIAAAEKAYRSGDTRPLVLPVCGPEPGEVLPGWPALESPEAWAAIENGKRPLKCADYGDDPKQYRFIRAARYAERYNRKLLELEGKRPK